MTKPKPTFAEQCLARANAATEGPWDEDVRHQFKVPSEVALERCYAIGPIHTESLRENEHQKRACLDAEFISHARQDVPELARRLVRACDALRARAGYMHDAKDWRYDEDHEDYKLAEELEAQLEQGDE